MERVDALGAKVRAALEAELLALPTRRVAVAASAGLDSTALMISLVALDFDVTVVSFTLEDRLSRDYKRATLNAQRLGLPILDVRLPTNVATIEQDVRWEIAKLGLKRKAEIECVWPFLYVVDQMVGVAKCDDGPRWLVTGSAADGHYGVSKKAMIHHRNTQEDFDAFRRVYFADPDRAQTSTLDVLARMKGLDGVVAPWRADSIVKLFLGESWATLNKPRQKEPVRRAYAKELAELKVDSHHVNLQLGDSGIANQFKKLLPLLPTAKSPTAVYNAIRSGRI